MSPAKQLQVKDLAPSEHNPRTITGERLEALGRAMREYGDLSGVVYNRRTKRLVGGHQRIKHIPEDAKVTITERHKRPTRTGTVATGTISFDGEEWTYREVSVPASVERMMNLAANAHGGEFDDMLLGATLFDMAKEDDFTLDSALLTGLDPKEVDKLIRSYEKTQHPPGEDPLPELPAKPKSKLGTVYELGPHRLMCGDATKQADMDRLMDGRHANIVFTSPPYNAGALEIEGQAGTQKKYQSINDSMTSSEYAAFMVLWSRIALSCADELLVNVQFLASNKVALIEWLAEMRLQFKDVVYWVKDSGAPNIAANVLNSRVEVVLCFGVDNKRAFKRAQWQQGTQWNVLEGGGAGGNEYADVLKATFPLYVPTHFLENYVGRGDVVLDPFGGSGTTLIAAEDTGRICYMMEIDPGYCDVIRQRYKNFCARRDGAADGEGEAA